MKLSKIAAAGLAAVLLVPMTAACGSDGKDTKCSDFLKQSQADQRTTVRDWAKSEATNDAERKQIDEAKDSDVDMLVELLKSQCQKDGNGDKAIKDLKGDTAATK